MACSQLRRWPKSMLILVFVCGFAVPAALFLIMDGSDVDNAQPQEVQTVLQFSQKDLAHESILGHERKTLDYRETSDESDALKFQIREMQQIRVSARNELKQLEHERFTLGEQVQIYGNQLSSLQRQISSAKSELQEYKVKLARITRETNRASRKNYSHAVPLAPIVLVDISRHKPSEYRPRQRGLSESVSTPVPVMCTFESCFDLSRCPLSKPFSIYVYNNHQPFTDQFTLKHSDVLSRFMSTISDKHLVTNNPERACIFVVIVGPLALSITTESQNPLIALPYWNSDGANHIVVDLSRPDFKKSLATFNTPPSSRAIFANMWSNRLNYDILIPPVRLEQSDNASHKSLWKGLPMHLPVFRSILVYFEGQLEIYNSELGEDDLWVSVDYLEMIRDSISSQTTDKLLIKTNCESYLEERLSVKSHFGRNNVAHGRGSAGEWSLCGDEHYRSLSLAQSTFTLILSSKSGHLSIPTYTRIIEGLRFGAVPVFIGIKLLPFDSVIDWSRAAIRIPPSRIGEVHVILRSLQPDKVLEYRRQGRFLWETYFSSLESVFDTILAIVRSKCLYPPPPATDGDVTIKSLISLPQESVTLASPVYQQNFTIYSTDFWNSPPGPFYMYPVTPFKPSPVSGRQYEGLSREDIAVLPSHVIQAGGITGPHFEDFLLGNTPDEQFTVLILTYERDQVLLEAIKRLDDLQSLAKVVVVWNSPSPPKDLRWPTIGVPVEVVSVGRNSLNNRFLPLPNIQTEAVLSIDDDVHLRHDEIQFAFRVWREARDRIVGFPGRFHARDVRYSSWLYNSNYTCELSMVLTGAAFVHKYYLYLYSQWMPQVIRDIVDEYINCEDIAMNFLVSHITRKPPLKVTSRWTFRCPGCPENLSSNEEHFNERHICMNKFTEVYGYIPLLYTQFRLDSVLFKTRLPSNLEKCYSFV